MPGKMARDRVNEAAERSGLTLGPTFEATVFSPIPLDRYTVSIKRTRTVRKATGKDWTKTGEELVSQADIDKAEYASRSAVAAGTLKQVYGYTPEIEKWVEETDTVFEQRCDGLDLVRVIRAINGIE